MMGKRIKKSLEGSEKQRVERGGNSIGWWDEECRERKKEVRKELRNWRRIGGNKDMYKEMKKGYKEICEKKKREERERWVREAGKARAEGKVWDLIRKERKRKKKVNEEIEMEGWKKYFMIILGGVEEKVVREGRERRDEQEEMELEWEEVKRVIDGLKDGKAIGNDGIPNEVWKYRGEDIKRWTWEICRKVWRKKGWPEDWKDIIIPIIKERGGGKKVKDYKGVTLMPSLYKIYTAALGKRLRREVEERELLSVCQAGFRRRMGTMDQVYAMNYLINRQLGKKRGKMITVFVDLKAAFDSIDREILIRAMRERGVGEKLVKRVDEMLRETRSRVRVGERVGKEFWTARGVRQRCPLSPILFNIMLADLQEEMEKERWRQ